MSDEAIAKDLYSALFAFSVVPIPWDDLNEGEKISVEQALRVTGCMPWPRSIVEKRLTDTLEALFTRLPDGTWPMLDDWAQQLANVLNASHGWANSQNE